jgi:hypothetical protein
MEENSKNAQDNFSRNYQEHSPTYLVELSGQIFQL